MTTCHFSNCGLRAVFLYGALAALLAWWPLSAPAQEQTPTAPPGAKQQSIPPKATGTPAPGSPAPKMPEKAPPRARMRTQDPEMQRSSTRKIGGMEIRAKEGEGKE